jgi:hypothetical protein
MRNQFSLSTAAFIAVLVAPAALADGTPGSSTPAPVPQSTNATPAAPIVTNNDTDVVVCRVTPKDGSRIGGEKECRTKAQWAILERESQDYVEQNAQYQMMTSH